MGECGDGGDVYCSGYWGISVFVRENLSLSWFKHPSIVRARLPVPANADRSRCARQLRALQNQSQAQNAHKSYGVIR